MPAEIDPRIFYCLALPNDDPRITSPFQGFSQGWMALPWAMRQLIGLPTDALEPALPRQANLARRIAGTGGWHWFPLALKALRDISIEATTPFWVVFSGTERVARSVSAWADSQDIRPLQVTPAPHDGAIVAEALDTAAIRSHIQTTLDRLRQRGVSLDSDLIDQANADWTDRPVVDATFAKREHNCTLPNHMVLEGAGIRFNDSTPLIGRSTDEYVAAIRETVDAVLQLRQDAGYVPAFRLTPPQPALILTAPALFRNLYRNTQTVSAENADDPKIVNKVLRILQRQKTFQWSLEAHEHVRLLASEEARAIIGVRQEELEIHTLSVGLRAASTLAATIRLPPAVNRTAGVVRQFATHARASGTARPGKFKRVFAVVQNALSEAVGPEVLQVIEGTQGGIKLVTDAPIEWLPVGALPLGLKFDCSRITATPGNLMAGELVFPNLLRLGTTAFSDILVVSAFGADDPIRHMIPAALDASASRWRDKLSIRSVAVASEAAFCDTLNAYDGGILIFDGHAHHSDDTDVATLAIGDDNVDVWSLRNRVRVPPVVILSACDTHAADRSHATTANAFLAAGARAVLGTMLPINAWHAATFVSRLLLRISDFLPAAIATRREAIQWSEVIGGMLRMQLLTDLLRPYLAERILSWDHYQHVHTHGNAAINYRRTDWFEFVAGLTAERSTLSLDQVNADFRSRIPSSDTIRYLQLGNPETILIGDPSILQHVEADLEQAE